ncbi:MAG TPA: hypothetical protein VGL35_06110 [Rhizomicrobium sp.]|jgi:hypothetical protein
MSEGVSANRRSDYVLWWAFVIVLAVLACEFAWLLATGAADHSANAAAQYETKQNEPWWWIVGSWFISATFWTAFFTATLTFSTVRLWLETRRLARGSEDQSEKMAASIMAAKKSAEAGVDAAKAMDRLAHEAWQTRMMSKDDRVRQRRETASALAVARQANEIAREIGQSQVRAYLVIRKVELAQYAFAAQLHVTIANIGATPVRWLETEGNAKVLGQTTLPANGIPLDGSGKSTFRWPIDPGKEGSDVPLFTDEDHGKALKTLLRRALNKEKLVVQGTIRWETMFGEIFESTFLFWGTPEPPTIKDDVQIPQQLTCPAGVETVSNRHVNRVANKDA